MSSLSDHSHCLRPKRLVLEGINNLVSPEPFIGQDEMLSEVNGMCRSFPLNPDINMLSPGATRLVIVTGPSSLSTASSPPSTLSSKETGNRDLLDAVDGRRQHCGRDILVMEQLTDRHDSHMWSNMRVSLLLDNLCHDCHTSMRHGTTTLA